MSKQHKWSLHQYLCDSRAGVLPALNLSSEQTQFLKQLRKQAREGIRDLFTEVQEISKESSRLTLGEELTTALKRQFLMKDSFKASNDQDLNDLVDLFSRLEQSQVDSFLDINPKFWTQGSFTYKTLNAPYYKPPQEMDIDDGVYFPMKMFEDFPALAHTFMIALVDTALRSIANKNEGWSFDDSKKTCARIRVEKENIHLDVPMYAIPEEKMQIMQDSKATHSTVKFQKLDQNSIYLARRDREKWQKSDPMIVQEWFTSSVSELGEHVRSACRFLKRWRDVRWKDGGGPSSITLMKCTVDTLGQSCVDINDMGLILLEVTKKFANQLNEGVESPDPDDEKPLFPDQSQHEDKHRHIVQAALELNIKLENAMMATTREDSYNSLVDLFGECGVDKALLISVIAAPAYIKPAKKSKPIDIEATMTSG
jgi:hypothetical protein